MITVSFLNSYVNGIIHADINKLFRSFPTLGLQPVLADMAD